MSDVKIIAIDPANIAQQHICCALADKKCAAGYAAKKRWLAEQHANGYVFKRLDVRGKAFIEYVAAEHAWLPLDADGYMVVNCFWVAGRFKGQGNGRRLLQQCADDARAMNGIVAVSAERKRPFMSDPKFLERQGFVCVDTAPPFFRLWCRQTQADAAPPRFKDSARSGRVAEQRGIVAFYSDCCPFAAYWTDTVLRAYAERRGIPCTIQRIESREQAQALPIPWVINSVFYNGQLVTLELDSGKRLDALLGRQ